MRHAWEHWHWIASCKVGPLGRDVNAISANVVVLLEAHLAEYKHDQHSVC